jgi:hypothetical protein
MYLWIQVCFGLVELIWTSLKKNDHKMFFFIFYFFIEIHPQRLMDKMEQPRARDRQRQQPMSSSQRQTYLARRRAIAQGKRPMVETSSSNITKQAAGTLSLNK